MTRLTIWINIRLSFASISVRVPSYLVRFELSNTFIDKNTKETTSYIDVKSEPLREVLRDVLRDVKAVSLMEDKPSVRHTCSEKDLRY